MKSIAKVSCLCLALGYGFSYTHAATARVATAQQDNTRVQYTSNRPQERLFVSNAVEKQIKRVKSLLTNARLAWMFENCFPNTLDTTVHFDGDDDTFVYTGDIHAMWLRDSGAQVWPYVQLANQDPRLKKMLAGVINRQFNVGVYSMSDNKNLCFTNKYQNDLDSFLSMIDLKALLPYSFCDGEFLYLPINSYMFFEEGNSPFSLQLTEESNPIILKMKLK